MSIYISDTFEIDDKNLIINGNNKINQLYSNFSERVQTNAETLNTELIFNTQLFEMIFFIVNKRTYNRYIRFT